VAAMRLTVPAFLLRMDVRLAKVGPGSERLHSIGDFYALT